ncbi:MAG: FAD:protein FMN transferase [Sphingobacteriaceae bacterium]|nr:FAD:protein FMN transferase [Sphingobacteriaceae bacterium]
MKQLALLLLVLFTACSTPKDQLHKFSGATMGTTYNVVYAGELQEGLQAGVDSMLVLVNASLSTYIPTSTISRFNQAENSAWADEMVKINFEKAVAIWQHTDGAFDPTVGPLVNAWGFGFQKMQGNVDSARIDSLLPLVGLAQVQLRGDSLYKAKPGIILDFSAIAKGYGVDVVALYLESQGVKNYIVEIGGELRAAGEKAPSFKWIAGIEKPIYDQSGQQRELQMTVPLANKSMATSGNYRNFYEKDGKKYAHTIHPKTGYPSESNLLSASVVANDCMTADGYATAFMVMGFDAARSLVEATNELEAVFLYSDSTGAMQEYISPGLTKIVKQP